jgi:hypothetical protein
MVQPYVFLALISKSIQSIPQAPFNETNSIQPLAFRSFKCIFAIRNQVL